MATSAIISTEQHEDSKKSQLKVGHFFENFEKIKFEKNLKICRSKRRPTVVRRKGMRQKLSLRSRIPLFFIKQFLILNIKI